jgi:hypothetical protein
MSHCLAKCNSVKSLLNYSVIPIIQVKQSQITLRPGGLCLGVSHPFRPPPQIFPPLLNYFYTVTDLLMWGALSDEKTGL